MFEALSTERVAQLRCGLDEKSRLFYVKVHA
jgi:hypothetical protein